MQSYSIPPQLDAVRRFLPLFFFILFIVLLKFPQFFIPLLILSILFFKSLPHLAKQWEQRTKNKSFIDVTSSSTSQDSNPFTFFTNSSMHPGKIIQWVVGIIIVALILINSIVIIPAGTTGVYHLFGKVRDNEVRSGFHLINPLAQVTLMSIRTEEYTMSIVRGEGKRAQSDAIDALTKEGLTVTLDLTVFYRLQEEKASDVFRELGTNYEEKIIRPSIRAAIREIIAQYEAKDIYSEKRQEATGKIVDQLAINLEQRGIAVEDVLLRNVILPSKLAESIQSKLTAEQEAQRYDFVLQKEEKEAERKRVEAAGQRDAQQIITESLTDKYLNFLYLQGLKDKPGTFYVPVSPNNGLPLFKNVP